jgi:aryl-alcohol dehydrogenase-like predicted oxidoreductase
MNSLVQAGKVRYLAVSNRSTAQLDQEQDALLQVSANPARRIVGVQNHYSLLERPRTASLGDSASIEDEAAFLDYLGSAEIGLVPYFPLAAGMLTGRYLRGKMDADGRLSPESGEGLTDRFITERSLDIVLKLDEIARRKGCTIPQLAIAWLLSMDVVCSVIAGVTRLEQLEDNAGAPDVSLTTGELEELDQLTR